MLIQNQHKGVNGNYGNRGCTSSGVYVRIHVPLVEFMQRTNLWWSLCMYL